MRMPFYNNKVFKDIQEVIDILTPYKDSVMLCLSTAASFTHLSCGSPIVMNVEVYSRIKLVIPDIHVYYEPDCFETKEYTTFMGIYITTDEQTILDMLEDEYEEGYEEIPSQDILESLGNYYYLHQESFNGLEDRMNEKQREAFEAWKQWGIDYWNEDAY